MHNSVKEYHRQETARHLPRTFPVPGQKFPEVQRKATYCRLQCTCCSVVTFRMGDTAKKQRAEAGSLTKLMSSKHTADGPQQVRKAAVHATAKSGKQKQAVGKGPHAAPSRVLQQVPLLAARAQQDWSEEHDIPEPSPEELEHGISQLLAASACTEGRALTQGLVVEQHAPDAQLIACPAARASLLAGLTRLRLDRQRLMALDEDVLRAMPSLTHVYLQHNQIRSIQPLTCLCSLQFAALSHNQITQVEGVADLPELMLLDISYNQISELHVSQLPAGSLRFMKLEGNPCMSGADAAAVRAAVLQHLPQLRDLDGPLENDTDGSDDDSSSQHVMSASHPGHQGMDLGNGASAAMADLQVVTGGERSSLDGTPPLLAACTEPLLGSGARHHQDMAASWNRSVGRDDEGSLTGVGSHLSGSISGKLYGERPPTATNAGQHAMGDIGAMGDIHSLHSDGGERNSESVSGSRQLQTAVDMLEWLERGCVDSSMTALMASLQVNTLRASDALRASAVGLPGYRPASRPGSAMPGNAGTGNSRPTTPILHSQQQQQQQQNQECSTGPASSTRNAAQVLHVQQSCKAKQPSTAAGGSSTRPIASPAVQSQPLSRQLSNPTSARAGDLPPRTSTLEVNSRPSSSPEADRRPSSGTGPLPRLNSITTQGNAGVGLGHTLPHRLSGPLSPADSVLLGRASKASDMQARPSPGQGMSLEQQMDKDLEQLQARLQALLEPLTAAAAQAQVPSCDAATGTGSSTGSQPAMSHVGGASQQSTAGPHSSGGVTSQLGYVTSQLMGRPPQPTDTTHRPGSAASVAAARTASAGAAARGQAARAGAPPYSTKPAAAASKPGSAGRATSAAGKAAKPHTSVSGTVVPQQASSARPLSRSSSSKEQHRGATVAPQGQLQQEAHPELIAPRPASAMAGAQSHPGAVPGDVSQVARQDLHQRLDRIMGAAAARVAQQRAAQQQVAQQLRAMRACGSIAKELKVHLNLKAAMAAGPGAVAAVRNAVGVEPTSSQGLDPELVRTALERHQVEAAVRGPDVQGTETAVGSGARVGGSGDTDKLRASLARLEQLSTVVMLEHGADVEALLQRSTEPCSVQPGNGAPAAAAAVAAGNSAAQVSVQQGTSKYQAVLARMARVSTQGMAVLDEEEEQDRSEGEDEREASKSWSAQSPGGQDLGNVSTASSENGGSDLNDAGLPAGATSTADPSGTINSPGAIAAATAAAGILPATRTSAYHKIVARAAVQQANKQDQ